MERTNKKLRAKLWICWAAVFAASLVFAGFLTACSGTGGGNSESSIEGVWKTLSIKSNGHIIESYPVDEKDGNGKSQMYYCFSEGLVYVAWEVTGTKPPKSDSLSKDKGKHYTWVNGVLGLEGESQDTDITFKISGNKAVMTLRDKKNEKNTTEYEFIRVTAPTVEQIKQAKTE